jgi:hypothetical protein
LQAGFTQVRVDHLDISTQGQLYLQTPLCEPENITTQGHARETIDLNKFPVVSEISAKTSSNMKLDLPHGLIGEGKKTIRVNRRIDFTSSYNCIVNLTAPNPRNLTIVPGMEKFLEHSLEEQIASYVDTWAK